MYLGIESMYESSKMLLDYMTHLYSFNAFLLDEVDENKVIMEGETVTLPAYGVAVIK